MKIYYGKAIYGKNEIDAVNKVLKKNNEVSFYLGNSIEILESFSDNSIDMIFADPPYGRFDLKPLVEKIYERLNKNGKLILECEKSQTPFLDADVSDYGNTRILTWTNL